MSKISIYISLTILMLTGVFRAEGSEEKASSQEFDPGEMITHHISDAHEWHFFTLGDFHGTIPLPVIVYSQDNGVSVFSSSKFHNENHIYNGYKLEHEHIYAVDQAGNIQEENHVYDFSITKNVASMFLSVALLLWVFLSISARYKKYPHGAPKGKQSFFEPIIIYIRDDVAKMAIGPKYEKYLPYLLTIFFFIWFNNLLGLLPGGANLTGNIAVTFILAIITFLITQFSGNKTYWGHIFNPPGVPHILKPIIVPIEIVGVFTKPFSLMIRLFANITAGHIIILSLLGLIFIFKNIGASLISIPFALFMSFLELFVAILQAYIFTLLSAMYFGGAVEEHSDHDHAIGYDGEEGKSGKAH